MDNTFKDRFSLEKMASDLWEAERFADFLEEQGLLSAPASLKPAVLERSRQTDIRVIAGTNRLSKNMELMRYSLKVGLAMACSIALLLTVPDFQGSSLLSQPYSDSPVHVEVCQKLQQLTGKIRLFSKFLSNPEVFFHD